MTYLNRFHMFFIIWATRFSCFEPKSCERLCAIMKKDSKYEQSLFVLIETMNTFMSLYEQFEQFVSCVSGIS